MLCTSVKTVKAIAESMGLGPGPAVKLPPQQSQRGFFWMTMCRRNWHLSSADQLAALLDASGEKVVKGWNEGIPHLRRALAKAPAHRQTDLEMELNVAQAAALYFRSAANQTRFIMLRDALADEIAAARQMYTLAKHYSTIGYEAGGQYYYLPLDLVEKVINCEYLRRHFAPQQ